MKLTRFNLGNLATFAGSGALWAVSEATPDVLWKTVLNAGGFGVMAMMLYRIHTNAVKTHAETLKVALETFRGEIAAERKECSANIDKLQAAIKEVFNEFLRLLGKKESQ